MVIFLLNTFIVSTLLNSGKDFPIKMLKDIKNIFIRIIKKTISFDPELIKVISLFYENGRDDGILHYINFRFCQFIYKVCHPFSSKKNNQNYFLFENTDLTNVFSNIAQHMKDNVENERKQKKKRNKMHEYVKLTNYSFVTIPPHQQQLYFDHIPNTLLKKLNFSLEKSGLFEECSRIINTNFTVSQTRAWLFFTSNNKNNTPIQKHHDVLPPGTLKIMTYQGRFTEDLPALILHPINSNPVKIVGDDPILIFNSCAIEHEVTFPDRVRPTIEITLTPSVKNSYEAIQAGYMAGTKYNPFLKAKSGISTMVTK